MPVVENEITRGKLFVEKEGETHVFNEIPFVPVRAFTITKVPRKYVRGKHAHPTCHQFLMCVQGWLQIRVKRPGQKSKLLKLILGEAVYVPPMTWIELLQFSEFGTLTVLASEPYDPENTITSLKEFNGSIRRSTSADAGTSDGSNSGDDEGAG